MDPGSTRFLIANRLLFCGKESFLKKTLLNNINIKIICYHLCSENSLLVNKNNIEI